MPTPGEHKTVQARILEYAEAIGWTIVSREAAEKRRGGIPAPLRKKDGDDGDRNVPAPFSLFFDDLLDAQLRTFNPRYTEPVGALLEQFRHLHTDIYGNREFIEHLRNRGKFFDHEENRERDLILIDYDDPSRNVYEVTEEWAFLNGHYGTREDVVFLINGIPVLVIEDVAHAVPIARALVAGGLRVLEVTLRTPAALDVIRAMRSVTEPASLGVSPPMASNLAWPAWR